MIGSDWLSGALAGIQLDREHLSPVEFNEKTRYLPESVTSIPGYIRFDVNPFMREIIECFDVESPVREVSVKKGVQITYTTALESILLYYMAHVKTVPCMFLTADAGLAKARMENNIRPMIQLSGLGGIIKSADVDNPYKRGDTVHQMQWEGGGYLVPFGANAPNKMRSFSVRLLLKDEIDGWPLTVGKDGDPDSLTDARCSASWEQRKIFRGSTPTIEGVSKIEAAFRRGDQRIYRVLCRSCGFPQALRWRSTDEKTGVVGGFLWETENGVLLPDSVRYACQNCGHFHYEHDKAVLFDPNHGAHWHPTATPVERNIRSYHIPALYSPVGMMPWSKAVSDYLEAWDETQGKARDIAKYQVFYNNILGEPFRLPGFRLKLEQVQSHRRSAYLMGQIPNKYAIQYAGGRIGMLTLHVDVHDSFLAVAVFGWARDAKCFLVDYWHLKPGVGEGLDCSDIDCSVWRNLAEIIEMKEYTADDGVRYRISMSTVDAGYMPSTVAAFCSNYASGVVPTLGRARAARGSVLNEFRPYQMQEGSTGYQITVDYYKDRIAPVLKRAWYELAEGMQYAFHFNCPMDTTDSQLLELTNETKKRTVDPRGLASHEWIRHGRNELWDLLVYGHATVEIMAYSVCRQHFGLDTVDWKKWWDYVESGVYFAYGEDVGSGSTAG